MGGIDGGVLDLQATQLAFFDLSYLPVKFL